MRIVSPFRPFHPESPHHQALMDFNWIGALRMMGRSAGLACQCPVHVLTDVDTDLPLRTLQYTTTHRRLMLWALEVCGCYLASDDFDDDTVMLDADQLVYHDLAPWFTGADLGVLVRPGKMSHNPLLNGVQWWRRGAKDQLVAFYRQALTLAETLPEASIVWGADTEAVAGLIAPIAYGIQERAGLRVSMIPSTEVLHTWSRTDVAQLASGRLRLPPRAAVVDFRGVRKSWMKAVYKTTHAGGQAA